jgi:ribosomal protein S18 acetylase RimI-like enzyme
MKEKYVEMVCHLSEQTIGAVAPPTGFEVKPLSTAPVDDLYPCYYAAFEAGDARFFFEQSEEERREYFDTLGLERALNEPASVVLVKGQRIAGFTCVLPYGEGNRHISCMCVHPDFQRKGLGKFLLRLVVNAVAQGGHETITLGTSTGMGAFHLYRKHGFEVMEKDVA